MKNLFRAYMFAILGLFLGVVGMHRFYLNFNISGGLMLFLFAGGITSLVLGYAQLLTPLIAELVIAGGNLDALPKMDFLNLDANVYPWFVVGTLASLASLCWLVVDLIVMGELVQKANSKEK